MACMCQRACDTEVNMVHRDDGPHLEACFYSADHSLITHIKLINNRSLGWLTVNRHPVKTRLPWIQDFYFG